MGPVDRRLLCGSPALGGFGILPLFAHTRARHLAQASGLIRHPLAMDAPVAGTQGEHGVPRWVHLAAALLRHAVPSLHPAQTLLAATLSSGADVAGGVLGIAGPHQPHSLPNGPLTRMLVALQAAGRLTSALSPLDMHALLTTPHPHPARLAADLESLGWGDPGIGDTLRPAASAIPVRRGTALLSGSVRTARHAAHQAFVQAAMGNPSATQLDSALAAFRQALAAAWSLHCPNTLKQTLWILAVNGIPGARVPGWACPCGRAAHADTRLHTFWHCPVAQTVVDRMSAVLAAWASPSPAASTGTPQGPPSTRREHALSPGLPCGCSLPCPPACTGRCGLSRVSLLWTPWSRAGDRC